MKKKKTKKNPTKRISPSNKKTKQKQKKQKNKNKTKHLGFLLNAIFFLSFDAIQSNNWLGFDKEEHFSYEKSILGQRNISHL